MAERSYTVGEIDALRRCVDNQYLWGWYGGPRNFGQCGPSRSYNEVEKTKIVEERVRTYMLAGITADDLLATERDAAQVGRHPEGGDANAAPASEAR